MNFHLEGCKRLCWLYYFVSFIYLRWRRKSTEKLWLAWVMHWVIWQRQLSISDVLITWSLNFNLMRLHTILKVIVGVTTVSTQRSVFFCFMKCRSWIEWIKEDKECSLEKMVLSCFKCMCWWERLVIQKTWRQGSGGERRFSLFTNRTNETKTVNSFPVWEWPLAAPSQSPLSHPAIGPVDMCY